MPQPLIAARLTRWGADPMWSRARPAKTWGMPPPDENTVVDPTGTAWVVVAGDRRSGPAVRDPRVRTPGRSGELVLVVRQGQVVRSRRHGFVAPVAGRRALRAGAGRAARAAAGRPLPHRRRRRRGGAGRPDAGGAPGRGRAPRTSRPRPSYALAEEAVGAAVGRIEVCALVDDLAAARGSRGRTEVGRRLPAGHRRRRRSRSPRSRRAAPGRARERDAVRSSRWPSRSRCSPPPSASRSASPSAAVASPAGRRRAASCTRSRSASPPSTGSTPCCCASRSSRRRAWPASRSASSGCRPGRPSRSSPAARTSSSRSDRSVLRTGDQVLVVAALGQVAEVEERLRSVSRYGRLAGWARTRRLRLRPRARRAGGGSRDPHLRRPGGLHRHLRPHRHRARPPGRRRARRRRRHGRDRPGRRRDGVLRGAHRRRLERHLPALRDDGHRRRPQADRALRVPRAVGGAEVGRAPLQAARAARPRHAPRSRRSSTTSPACCWSRPVTLSVCRRLDLPPGAVPDLADPRLQHRRHVDPHRRPAQHHHRQPRGPELRRLPRPLAAADDHPAGALRRDGALALPQGPRRHEATSTASTTSARPTRSPTCGCCAAPWSCCSS